MKSMVNLQDLKRFVAIRRILRDAIIEQTAAYERYLNSNNIKKPQKNRLLIEFRNVINALDNYLVDNFNRYGNIDSSFQMLKRVTESLSYADGHRGGQGRNCYRLKASPVTPALMDASIAILAELSSL